MRGRLVLSSAKKGKDKDSLERAKKTLDSLESEMSQCVAEFNKLMAR
jgi:hypothetical protein